MMIPSCIKPGGVQHEEITFKNAVKHTLSILVNPASFETSGDMIFSGHTRFIAAGWCAMSSLITSANSYYTIPLFILLLILGVTGLYFFEVSRLHFSVDIILGVFITVSLWYMITSFSELAISQVVADHQPLLMRLFISFLAWFNMYCVCLNKQLSFAHYSKYHPHYYTSP